MSQQSVGTTAAFPVTRRIDLLLAFEALVTSRSWTFRVVTFVNLCIGVPQFDGNVPLQLVLESDGLHTGDGLDHGGFPVCHMPNRPNVDRSLSGDDLGGERG